MKNSAFCFLIIICLLNFNSVKAWDSPALSSPDNGESVWTGVTLDWNAVPNSEKYHLQVDTTEDFNSPVLFEIHKDYISTSSSNADTRHYSEDLYFNQIYYWRVRAYIEEDTSEWNTRSFTTRDYVTLTTPYEGDDDWTGLSLYWNSHHGVSYYDLQIDTSSNFDSPVFYEITNEYINTSSSNADTQHYIKDLYFGKTYYWRVRARNEVDSSVWTTRSFITRDYVTLSSPSDGLLNVNTDGITLYWNAHVGVSAYQMELDTISLFNSDALVTIENEYINSSSSNPDTRYSTGELSENTVYFWRVRAVNTVDTCSWTTRSFSTGSQTIDIPNIPVLVSPANNAENIDIQTQLVWQESTNATSYEYIFGDSPDLNESLIIETHNNNVDLDELEYLSEYFWKVRAKNGTNIYSDWSDMWIFTTRGESVFYELSLEVSPEGAATVTGEGFYEFEEHVLLTASAEEGFGFLHWIDKYDLIISELLDFEYIMPEENMILTAVFDDITKITDVKSDYDFYFYPNPASTILNVNISDFKSFEILDITGRVLQTFNNDNEITEIDISDYANGTYFIRYKNNYKTFTKKLIIR